MRYRLASDESVPDALLDRPVASDPLASLSMLVGESPAFRHAIETAMRLAGRTSSVLLLVGEAGTGKELLARAIHRSGVLDEPSTSRGPFVPVECGALPIGALEAELFGGGAGTGRTGDAHAPTRGLLARTGTVFLGEVGELPQDLQPKLLKALEERRMRRSGAFEEADVRSALVASTTQPLEDLIVEGRFRDDLFERMSPRVTLPPLREREGDVQRLAEHFLSEIAESRGLPPIELSSEALGVLEAHDWPGNVRELRIVLRRAALLAEEGEIVPRHLSIGSRTELRSGENADAAGFIAVPSDGRTLASVEAEAVRLALRITGWNRSAAARMLGISRPTLARKIELHSLEPDEEPAGR